MDDWYGNAGHFSGGDDNCDDEGNNNNFPGGAANNHQCIVEETEICVEEAEASTSLAPAKPKTRENNDQSEVSIIFTPLEIMLFNNGLDSSQAALLRWTRGAVTTALITTKEKDNASPRSAMRWESHRQKISMSSPPSAEVCQHLKI